MEACCLSQTKRAKDGAVRFVRGLDLIGERTDRSARHGGETTAATDVASRRTTARITRCRAA